MINRAQAFLLGAIVSLAGIRFAQTFDISFLVVSIAAFITIFIYFLESSID
jgi:hypothetical protein